MCNNKKQIEQTTQPDEEYPRYVSIRLQGEDLFEGKTQQKVLWMQGRISQNQQDEVEVSEDDRETPENLGDVGVNYVSSFQGMAEKKHLVHGNLNWLFDVLSELHIKDDYVLDAYELGNEMGSRCELYVHRKNAVIEYKPDLEKRRERERRIFMTQREKEKLGPFEDYIPPYSDEMYVSMMLGYKEYNQIPPIWGYITVPFTSMGIWQAYLLTKAYSLLPKKLHGKYNNIDFIFEKSDIKQLMRITSNLLDNKDLAYLERCLDTGELLPHVEVNGNTAIVTCTFWSAWGGLRKRITTVTKNDNTVSFGDEKFETLIKYDCGIRF